MKNLITLKVAALIIVLSAFSQAQEILVVEPGLGNLNAAIQEHGGDKIYQLRAGAWYQLDGIIENVDFHLQIIGEIPADGGFPATVQSNVDAGGAVFQRMFDAKGDITLKNVYFMNVDLMGNVGSRFINQSKDGARTWLENCIVDPAGINDLIFVSSVNTKTYLYDNLILRHGHLNHYWDGQIVSHDAGQTIGLDTLIVENNTIVSAGSGIHNSGFAKKVDQYVRWNHNTIVFHKVNLDWSVWDNEYYFTNNLLFDAAVRPTPHEWNISLPGVDVAKPNAPLIMSDTVPGEVLPSERIQYVQYNLLYRNPELYALADELNAEIASQGKFVYHQPLMWPIDSIHVSREVCMFDNHEYFPLFLYGNTYADVDPLWEDELIYTYSDNIVNWVSNVARQELGLQAEPANQWKNWHWDLDGDPSINEAWPVFNGRYTNPDILTGSIEGLPLGDLNWYPEAKALWQEHKEQIEAHMRAGNVDKMIITHVSPVSIPTNITMYPNPARDVVTLNVQADRIVVFNITGSVVKSASFTNQINVSDLSEGLYFVRVNKGNEIHTQKIVVVK